MALLTITGHLFDATGTPLVGAVVRFQLVNFFNNVPTVTGTNILVPTMIPMITNSSGVYTGMLQGNDTISPLNTAYQVSFTPSVVAEYIFTGSGTINLDTFPPASQVPPPVGPVPSNILTGNNTFTGTNTFSGAMTLSGEGAAGNVAIKPATTDAVQFISVNGNDSNDGLSWGSAKGNADVATAIAAAIAALPVGGGTVFLGGGVFNTVATFIPIPAFVTICGMGMFSTTVMFNHVSSGFLFTPGLAGHELEGSALRDLRIEFSTGNCAGSNGVEVGGSGVAVAIQNKVVENVHIVFDDLAQTGSSGIFLTTNTIVECALCHFKNIIIENSAQMIYCNYGEGNFFDSCVGINIGANNSLLVEDTNGGNNRYNIRCESGSSNGTPLTGFSTNSAGLWVNATIDSNQTETALADTGSNNYFNLSLVGTGSNISLGTLATTSHLIVVSHNDTAVVPHAVFAGTLTTGIINTGFPITTVIANTTASESAGLILCNSTSALTITLPQGTAQAGARFTVKNINTGVVTVVGASGNIDGAVNFSIPTQYQTNTFSSDGTNYWII